MPQSGQETERPFDRLMNSYNSMEWEYVPRYSTVFMEMDHSPKIVLWKKIEDSNTQRAIGVIAVSLDVRKLLGANMDAHSASNTLLLSYDGEVALNRTGYELPGELVAGICAGAGGETSSVRSCLDLLRYYLELQRHRFGSRIQWKIEADREIYDALIPRLILQPLVESCIIHIRNRPGGGASVFLSLPNDYKEV